MLFGGFLFAGSGHHSGVVYIGVGLVVGVACCMWVGIIGVVLRVFIHGQCWLFMGAGLLLKAGVVGWD
jgi:hypothetical protein